jgi:mono/diheme cytochrome c family protein
LPPGDPERDHPRCRRPRPGRFQPGRGARRPAAEPGIPGPAPSSLRRRLSAPRRGHARRGHEAAPTETNGGETETGGETGTGPTETGDEAQGDPAAGKEVFDSVQPSCGTCHTLEAAGSTQTLGPNLDDVLSDKDAAFIRESIVDPDAEVAEGFPDNLMPEDYGDKLSDQELADLVAFLVQSTSGS